MLHIQEELRKGVALETYTQPPYSLIVKRHHEFPNLVLLKYNQIESDMDSPLVCQCRGLILDEADNWACVSRPFDKFWNAHEGRAATIDWTTARVQEKLDGSLMQLYHYQGTWRVATSGTPDASGQVNGADITFADLFWQTAQGQRERFGLPHNTRLTWLYELMTPLNRVVVRHTEPRLVCIGARDRVTGEEFCVENQHGSVRSFPLTSMVDVVKTFDTMQPLDQEGYVIVDDAFNRIKVKHPGYVALHHLRDNLTPRGIVDVVRRGEAGEVVASFPEWKPEFDRVTVAYTWLVECIQLRWDQWRHTVIQKEFALAVKDLPYSGVLFALRKGSVTSVREALVNVHIDRLTEWLKLGGTNGNSEAREAGPESGHDDTARVRER